MIYEEYEAIRKRISKKEEKLFKLMEKRDNLFAMTQPKSSQFDDEIVDGKNPVNTIEEFVMKDEEQQLSVRIDQLNHLLDDWYQALKRKREELKLSKNTYDRIYYYRFIEKLSIEKIAKMIFMSRSRTYDYYDNICQRLKK